MYLNKNQKKALIYMSMAGALLLGKEEGFFKLNYPFLTYALNEVDKQLTYLAQFVSTKEQRQIKRMLNNSKSTNTNDEFENVMMCYFAIDWCIENAFASKKYQSITKILKPAKTRLLGYLKKLKNNYSKDWLINSLANFYLEVEL